MRKTSIVVLTVAAGLLTCGGVLAQEDAAPDCNEPVTQMAMNECASLDYAKADKELNAQYRKTEAVMDDWDAELPDSQKGAEKALLKAQRAWIGYRDGHCEAVAWRI